jgi:BASS family bile acid:Na+ symporter
MNLTTLINVLLQGSIFLIIFAVGLTTGWKDAMYLLKRPGLLIKSILSMNIIMPLIALAAAVVFDINRAVLFAMIAFAVSPVPPMLPKKVAKAEGGSPYAIALLITAASLSVIFVPLSMYLMGQYMGRQAVIHGSDIAKIVIISILAPLFLGMLIKHLFPGFSGRSAEPISKTASVLMLVSLLPIMITSFPEIISLMGSGTLAAFIGFVLAGLITGHLLGGPEPNNRTVLAISTALRHPGVAIAIAATNFHDKKLAIAAILLYMAVNAVVTIPYTAWRLRSAKGEGGDSVKIN